MDVLVAMSREECLGLLGHSTLGRVAFTERALPAISAIGYTVVGSSLVLSVGRTGLGQCLDGQVVAFAVDELDRVSGAGWTVVVTGTARLLTDVHAAGELMSLVPEQVRGRRS